jgi:hypothetical protein
MRSTRRRSVPDALRAIAVPIGTVLHAEFASATAA